LGDQFHPDGLGDTFHPDFLRIAPTLLARRQGKKYGDPFYPIARFDNEVRHPLGALNLGLRGKDWLAAGKYTV
jgi:hypothetical protein